MVQVVEVDVVLGHQDRLILSENEGSRHTHDWKVYVKPIRGLSLRKFVKKVVFHLDENYRQPKRVIRKSPYEINESGNESFVIKIEIYFRNCESPNFVTVEYDLFLSAGRPVITHSRTDRLTFVNPDEAFKKRLLAAGGVSKRSDTDVLKTPKASPENQFLSPQKTKSAPKRDEKEGVPSSPIRSNGSRKRQRSQLGSIQTQLQAKKRSRAESLSIEIRPQNETYSTVESAQKKNISGRDSAVNVEAIVDDERVTASLCDSSVDSLDCESILHSTLGGFTGVMPISPLKM